MTTDNCVILVPVGGTLVPDCDRGLQELERRGYQVRRVYGFSQVDTVRSQMATDALADGFEELIWIDSDIVFDPDDIERLRAHRVPMVCGIYPKKGRREFACNCLPGNDQLVMGRAGGLSELLYSGFGFNYTHRQVYESIQEKLSLPVCNEHFDSPLIPFFMTMVAESEHGPWYLGEDYAFCERARQCGYRIHVDTRIRLWHVGNYRYSWEDAGSQLERFDTFYCTTDGIKPTSSQERSVPPGGAEQTKDNTEGRQLPETLDKHVPATRRSELILSEREKAWRDLQAAVPWPQTRPSVIPNRRHGWLGESTRQMLQRELKFKTGLVVELGAWLGLSTRFILDQSPAVKVVSIDHWQGSAEHRTMPEAARLLPKLFELFLANNWEYRDRSIPLRMKTVDGLEFLFKLGVRPDLIYIDADQSFEAVKSDLEMSRLLFPEATIVGDDWNWESVRQAVEWVAARNGLIVESSEASWKIVSP